MTTRRPKNLLLYLGLLYLAGTLSALPSLAEGQKADKDVLRVAAYVPEKSIGVSSVIKPWAEAVQRDTQAGLDIKTYWGGTLGKSPHKQFELVRNGVLDVAWILPSYTSGQFPEIGLFELPFLFRSSQEASVVGWQLHQEGLLTGFDGVKLIGLFSTEPSGLFLSQPVDRLEGIKNMKIRSVGLIQTHWLESLGASSQTLSAADMNQALSRGTIDGSIQGWSGMRTFKSFPLVNQSYEIPSGVIVFLLLINEKKFNSLPAETQQTLLKHGGLKIAQMGSKAYLDIGEVAREELRQEGRMQMSQPSNTDFAAYETHAEAIHKWWAERTPNGKQTYKRALELIEQLRSQQLFPGSTP